MLFNSFEFILIFLPIVWLGYFLLNRLESLYYGKTWLFAASLFFYSWWNPIYLPLIIVSVVFNFLLGTQINKASDKKIKKRVLIFGICVNIAALMFFKYTNFLVGNMNVFFEDQSYSRC